MIDLKQAQPDFTGTWYQDVSGGLSAPLSGDFEIFILDLKGNRFVGFKTDANGIAFIEGCIFKEHTIFTKDYAMHVKETTNAADTTLVYGFPQNIFNLKKDESINGSWCFPELPFGGKVALKVNTAFGISDVGPVGGNISKMLDILKDFHSSPLGENTEKNESPDVVDDLPF